MGRNREKFNISIAILEKLQFRYDTKNYFAILGAPIIFSPTTLIKFL